MEKQKQFYKPKNNTFNFNQLKLNYHDFGGWEIKAMALTF